MNKKPIERKGTPFPKSAPRIPAVPLPKSTPGPPVARGPTTGAINHSLPEALQIKIPAGAAPPKQQVFQRPNPSISSVPKRKATPYPIRQDSKPKAPWNAARSPTPSPHAPSRLLRGQQPLRINSSLANSFQSTPRLGESIPPTRRKHDLQSSAQNQPQPVSNAKKSFKSIFKKKETKTKGSHTAGMMQHSSPRSPMAVRPAKTKTKHEEEREGAKDKKSKSSTGYSKGVSKQHDDLRDHGASRQHTTVNNIYISSSEKGTSSHIDKTYQPKATRHTHHATEVHHRTSPPPEYTASPLPPAYNFEDSADYKRRLRFHDTDESFHSERLCPLFDPDTRQPLTLKQFRELPRIPIQKFNSLMNLVEYPKRCSRAGLERLIPSNISRFLFVTADARDTASIEYVRERKATKLWARGWRVVVRVGRTETVTGWCYEF